MPRDISLLPTCYNILSKALWKRIIPYILIIIPFWQRAFLRKQGRQELIFTLKAEMDDFRHKSTKFIVVFIDFADAFGSVKHEFIFETLYHFGITEKYACLMEVLYKHSTFKVICGAELTKWFFIFKGMKIGDSLSALIFLLIIDRICKPMTNITIANSNLYNERNLNPISVQAFADDIVTVHANPTVIQLMFDSAERLMYSSGLDVKPSKCAVLYTRRSRNTWPKAKREFKPDIYVQGNCTKICDRNMTYKDLGKSIALSAEDSLQVSEIIDTYSDLVHKIQQCNLPLSLKASAFNNLALAKILHHFYNTRLSEE